MAKFVDYLKNIFWVLLLLQIAPTLIKSINKQYSKLLESKTKVAVQDLKGVIYESDTYIKDLKKLFEDDDIQALVLRIDSPGGTAGAAQNYFNEIKLLKCQYPNKIVIAFIENIAASGGYYIACAANHIISTPAAFIGSIGAVIAHPYFKEFIEQYKIKYEVTKSGEYKTAGNPFIEPTKEQKAMFQGLSDNAYQQFIKDVSEQRPGLPTDINMWANGKIFTGQQALELKLIDELGSQSTIIKALREIAHIEGKIEWVKPETKRSIFRSLFFPDQDEDEKVGVTSFVHSICQVLEERYSAGARF